MGPGAIPCRADLRIYAGRVSPEEMAQAAAERALADEARAAAQRFLAALDEAEDSEGRGE